ncbi:MAG: 2-hydroxyglutaryl-CoA dehydratase [Firmicutes bacterium]|nr:2-hydroxyglutaryl-CoA dehydratase [Bacillota bacterium]
MKDSKRLKIGIPQGMMYHTYAPFIDAFARELPVDIVYSGKTDREKLELGVRHCADDACLPVKVFCGHVKSLEDKCDMIAVPRIMSCEYGESLCPKLNGLPELVSGESELIFTDKLDLGDRKKLEKSLKKECRRIGIAKIRRAGGIRKRSVLREAEDDLQRACRFGFKAWKDQGEPRYCETDMEKTVFLAGHSYNIYDSFINMNLIDKLHRMNIGVITDAAVPRIYKEINIKHFMKKPFWRNLTSIYGAAVYLEKRGLIDGIICLSSFSCGTDSVTAELIRNETRLPILVLKLDEHTGEAGFDTRLEAFGEVLFS